MRTYEYNGEEIPIDYDSGLPKLDTQQFWRVAPVKDGDGFTVELVRWWHDSEPSYSSGGYGDRLYAQSWREVRREEVVSSTVTEYLRPVDVMRAACYLYAEQKMVDRNLLGTYGTKASGKPNAKTLPVPED